MKVVVDMCQSPLIADGLRTAGHDATHWPIIGPSNALDEEIARWAVEHDAVVPTHDLDFGDLLAASRAKGPSVIIVREEDTMPEWVPGPVLQVLAQFNADLATGSLISMTSQSARVRKLPMH